MAGLTLEEIRGLATDSKIDRVEGTLQAVYEPKTGNNSKGPWKVQNVILSQGDDSMRVTIFNGPNVDKGMEGEEVAILSSQTPKGIDGVKAEDNEWPRDSGEFTRQIRMDRTAQIFKLADAPKEGEAPPAMPAKPTASTSAPKKAWGGGGGGWKKKSPEEQARIERQHSQEMALRFHFLEVQAGTVTPTLDRVTELTTHFQNDLKPASGTKSNNAA